MESKFWIDRLKSPLLPRHLSATKIFFHIYTSKSWKNNENKNVVNNFKQLISLSGISTFQSQVSISADISSTFFKLLFIGIQKFELYITILDYIPEWDVRIIYFQPQKKGLSVADQRVVFIHNYLKLIHVLYN